MEELTFYRTLEEHIRCEYGMEPVEYLLEAARRLESPEQLAARTPCTPQSIRNLMARHGFTVVRHIHPRDSHGEDTAGAADGRAAAGGVR